MEPANVALTLEVDEEIIRDFKKSMEKKYCFREMTNTMLQEKYGMAWSIPYSGIVIEYYGGAAAAHEPEGGAAYPHRQNEFDLVIVSNWPDKNEDEKQWKQNLTRRTCSGITRILLLIVPRVMTNYNQLDKA